MSYLAWLLESKRSVESQLIEAMNAHDARLNMSATVLRASAATLERLPNPLPMALTAEVDPHVPPNCIWLGVA